MVKRNYKQVRTIYLIVEQYEDGSGEPIAPTIGIEIGFSTLKEARKYLDSKYEKKDSDVECWYDGEKTEENSWFTWTKVKVRLSR